MKFSGFFQAKGGLTQRCAQINSRPTKKMQEKSLIDHPI
jgi:hypothetical protein